jgi:hypothetical protein
MPGSDRAQDFALGHRVGVIDERAVARGESYAQARVPPERSDDARVQADLPLLDIGRPFQLLDAGRADALHPHALPDAAGAVIPD